MRSIPTPRSIRRSEKNAASICAEVKLYVFFVLDHGIREVVHALVTADRKSEWFVQQLLETCGISREPLR